MTTSINKRVIAFTISILYIIIIVLCINNIAFKNNKNDTTNSMGKYDKDFGNDELEAVAEATSQITLGQVMEEIENYEYNDISNVVHKHSSEFEQNFEDAEYIFNENIDNFEFIVYEIYEDADDIFVFNKKRVYTLNKESTSVSINIKDYVIDKNFNIIDKSKYIENYGYYGYSFKEKAYKLVIY